jgi:O-antigen ligase
LKVVGIVLIFDPGGALMPFDLPKTIFSRAVEWLLLSLLVLGLARYGLGIVPRTRLHLAVAAYLGANVLAALFAEDRFVALYGTQERLLGLAFVLDMTLLYAAVAVAFRTTVDWLVLGVGFLVGLIGASGYAIVQALGLDPIAWTDDPRTRPFGTLGNPDMFGHFLAVAFGACLGIAVVARRAAVVATTAAIIVLVFTLSLVVATRGTALGVAGAVIVAIPSYVFTRRLSPRTIVRAGVVLFAALGIFVVALTGTPLGGRLSETMAGVGVRDRVLIYESAFRAFRERPIVGWGPDNFGVAYPRYRSIETAVVSGPGQGNNSAHSWPLQAMVTTGIVGTTALGVVLVAGLWILTTRGLPERPIVAAALLVGSVAYWTVGIVSVGMIGVDWVPWVAWGGAAALAAGPGPVVVRQVARPLSAAAIASAVLLAGLGMNLLLASRAAHTARAAIDKGLKAPPGVAEEAAARDPGRADYWNELGRTRFSVGDLAGAEAAFESATERAPYQAAYWSNLAIARAGLVSGGTRSAALALDAARRATVSDPNDPIPHVAFAEVALALGQNRDALAALVEAIRLYPRDPRYDQLAIRAARGMADLADARAILKPVFDVKDSTTLRVGMAELSLALRDLPDARAQALRALQLDPNNPDARRLLDASGG